MKYVSIATLCAFASVAMLAQNSAAQDPAAQGVTTPESMAAQISSATQDNPYRGIPASEKLDWEKNGPKDHRMLIINRTSKLWNRIEVSAVGENNWSDDIMPTVLLDPENQVIVDIATPPNSCLVDLKAVLDSPPEMIFSRVNVCTSHVWELRYKPIVRRVK
jgi:hypothetical protein